MSQKEFALFLDIPQPTLSAYENEKNNPTVDVLIKIANKCNVSLDWLTGRGDSSLNISSMKDFVLSLYDIALKNEIDLKIHVEETKDNSKKASIIFYNEEIKDILKDLNYHLEVLESYSITKDQFDRIKNDTIEKYSLIEFEVKFYGSN